MLSTLIVIKSTIFRFKDERLVLGNIDKNDLFKLTKKKQLYFDVLTTFRKFSIYF